MTEIMRETDRQLKEMAERLRLCMLRDNMSELMNMATERRLSPRELLMFLFNKEIEQREINRIKLTTMGRTSLGCVPLRTSISMLSRL